jgi:hypothetical protein
VDGFIASVGRAGDAGDRAGNAGSFIFAHCSAKSAHRRVLGRGRF